MTSRNSNTATTNSQQQSQQSAQTAVDLDTKLNQVINTDPKWTAFQREILDPLLREECSTTNVNTTYTNLCSLSNGIVVPRKRQGFPQHTESVSTTTATSTTSTTPNTIAETNDNNSNNNNDKYFPYDKVFPQTVQLPSVTHLTCIAILYHLEMMQKARSKYVTRQHSGNTSQQQYQSQTNVESSYSRRPNDANRVSLLNDFSWDFRERSFFSMVERPKPTQAITTEETQLLLLDALWRNGNEFVFTHNLQEYVIPVYNKNQLYKWKPLGGNDNETIDSASTTWKQIFAPLQHYQWFPPNSKLTNWSFTLDANTTYILSWYRFYLIRMTQFREALTLYATVLQRQTELRAQKETLLRTFVERNRTIKRNLRSNEIQRYDTSERAQRYRRFLYSLDKLYSDFMRTI